MEKLSGYRAVYADLLRTETAQEVLDGVKHWYEEAFVEKYEFGVLEDPDSGQADMSPIWHILFGPIKQIFPSTKRDFVFNTNKTLRETSIWIRILENHFGKDVGTRNCKFEICKHGRYNNYQRSFFDVFTEHVSRELSEICEKNEARIIGDITKISESEEFAKRRDEKRCESAYSDIKEVMLKWRSVPDQVLSDAIHEAAVEGVMDW